MKISVAAGCRSFNAFQRGRGTLDLAPALRRRLLGQGGNDVAVGVSPEPFGHKAVVGQAGAEEMSPEASPPCCRASPWLPSRRRFPRADEGNRQPDASTAAPLAAGALPLGGAMRGGGESVIDRVDR